LVVAVLLVTVVEMLVEKGRVLSLETFPQLVVAVAEITITRVHLADQVLEALKQAIQATEPRWEHPDKAIMVELTPQERLVAEAVLEA
jgi:hypothetical protein